MRNWRFAPALVLFMVFLVSAVLSPKASYADINKKRIIVIETMPVPVVTEHLRWFMTGMKDLGYIDGVNADIVVLKAQGDRQRAVTLLKKELEARKPDLVVTFATLASQAAYEVLLGTSIPILFFVVSDPVGAGLIQEIGEPSGTNISGRVFTIFRDIKIDMTMRLVGQIIQDRPVRMGIVHSDYPSSMGDVKALKHLAESRTDIKFHSYKLNYRKMPAGLDAMLSNVVKGIQALESDVDYWWQLSGPLGEVERYTEIILKHSDKPIVYGNTLKSVRMGALLTVNPDFEAGGREAAMMAHSVLEGTNPAGIPVTAPTGFDLGVNLSTALKLGIAVPSDMIALAENHVYR